MADSQKNWRPGILDKDDASLMTGAEYGKWLSALGYVWIDPAFSSLKSVKKSGLFHRDFPSVFSSVEKGKWSLQPGYVWSNPSGDLPRTSIPTHTINDLTPVAQHHVGNMGCGVQLRVQEIR